MKNKLIPLLSSCFILIVSCTTEESKDTKKEEKLPIDSLSIETPLKEDLNDVLLKKGLEVLQTLDPVDFSKLFYNAHPQKGILFSPYAFIDIETAKTFTESELIALQQSQKSIIWGEYDGSGEPIDLTLNDYLSRFVYDQDYRNAPLFHVDIRLGSGNSLDNLKEVFPSAHFIEFHFSGFDPKFEGMDWRSIRLVFDEIDGSLFLVAITHDEWTI
jgi:hypothetical protein